MTHKNLLVPNDGYECPAVNECGCPRCSWVRIKNDPDNTMIDLDGDITCAQGDYMYDGIDVDNRTCSFNPDPPITPVVPQRKPLIQGSIANQVLTGDKVNSGNDYYYMGASCIVLEEEIALPDDTTEKKERMLALLRRCDQHTPLPYNFYSIIQLTTTDMTICYGNNCNALSKSDSIKLSFIFYILIILVLK